MAADADIDFPYPPTPDDVPDGYTDYSPEYQSRQKMLLVWVFLVFGIYLGMITFFTLLTVWLAVLGFKGYGCCTFPLAVLPLLVVVYLVMRFFQKKDTDKRDLLVEVTEDEHPKLFAFVRKLCDEVGVDEPAAIHVLPEPNAMAITRTGLVHLFTPPKRELAVGIGLINALNLSEFKAVLAHEFGHFAQGGFSTVYAARAADIVVNLIEGQGWLERAINEMRGRGNVIGIVLYGVSWLIKSPLWLALKLFGNLRHELAREKEFHADRVAAALAGSNAIVHCLYRIGYAAETYSMAHSDLLKAADHKLFTSDLYYHQHAAGDILRKKKKDPEFGRPPKFASPMEGKKVQVFDAETAEDHPEDDYHPSDHEREEHVKAEFVPADDDERSAWILFDDPVELREKMTYKMYRAGKRVKKGAELDDPRDVQKFIDDEHYETTFDERYVGAYDDRLLNPGDMDDLDELIRKEPWEDARLAGVFDKLYHGLKDKVEDRKEVTDELAALRKDGEGALSKKLKRKIKTLERDLEEIDDWFRTLDRRVYLVYVQMSYRVGHDQYYDLVNRYRFHMAVQGIYKTARYHYNESDMYMTGLRHVQGSNASPGAKNAFVSEVLNTLREARVALKKLLREAREINMPAMKNFEEGERLADFLLDEDLIREPGEQGVSGKWIDKMFRQLEQVRRKASRLHFKSLGQILALQEKTADRFLVLKGFRQPPAPPASPPPPPAEPDMEPIIE